MVTAPPTAGSEPPDPHRIVEVVAAHVTLGPIRRGILQGDLGGECPFCGSRSFRVRPEHGTFHCFGCGEGGDAGGFLRLLDQHSALGRASGRPVDENPDHPAGGCRVNSANPPGDRRGTTDASVHDAAVDGRMVPDAKETVVNDDSMTGPGAHETSAISALAQGDTEDAKVLAILALASAVNRLASAQESIANPQP